MANTVNDVMNVIASPDYGIKNIAGTNQEILAILSGTHNSPNNIHVIANDVKNLLQKLVSASIEKKSVEVNNSNTSTKINHKHIQDILDETKGIRKAIINLENTIAKQKNGTNVGVVKLSDKASEDVAKAMISNIKRQNKDGGLSSLVDSFKKLKDISLKDIFLGNLKLKKLTEIFKDSKEKLNIKEDDLNSIIKIVNVAPEMVNALSKIGLKLFFINKNNIIKKLSDILVGNDSLLSLSQLLKDNEKVFDDGAKVAKNLKDLMSHLNKAMMKIFFTSMWAKVASGGIKSIEKIVEKVGSIANILIKNEKNINEGAKVAKNLNILVGHLLITSIFLTISAALGVTAILGALALWAVVSITTRVVEKLAENKKNMNGIIKTSLTFIAFSGLMAISSLFLSTIAITGPQAILGSIFLLGIVAVCSLTFKLLEKAKKEALIGSLVMLVMSASLMIFGIALSKITKATEKVTWKQVGIIATSLVILALATAVMGEPTTAAFISLGSLTMSLMSLGLIVFGTALGKITKSTENLKFKQILLVAGSMATLAASVVALGVLSPLIVLGGTALGIMGISLHTFVKTLKVINDMGKIPTKEVHEVLNIMSVVGKFFSKNALKPKAVTSAKRYKKIIRPLITTAHNLAKLNKIGTVPMPIVLQTLNAMHAISSYYIENPIRKKVIRQAERYKKMMKPFGNMLKHLSKLKELGGVPMALVLQTLNAMKTIANYYIENPIKRKVIRQAKKYKKMMKPFGDMLKHLIKLKSLGVIPSKLVYQTLNVMSTIANYYIENPIRKKVIKQAKKYQKLLKPFGKTIGYLSKLKEMGTIPAKLVLQTLDAMSTIANYYKENPIKKKAIKQARRYKKLLKPFGTTIKYLSKLKELGNIPSKLVLQTLDTMSAIANFYRDQKFSSSDYEKAMVASSMFSIITSHFSKSVESLKSLNGLQSVPAEAIKSITSAALSISNFYNNIVISDDIENKSSQTESIVDKFVTIAMNIQDKLTNIKPFDYYTIINATYVFKHIIKYYRKTKFAISNKKIERMNNAINSFVDNTNYIKNNISEFTKTDYNNVKLAVKSMKQIFKLLKSRSLNDKKAQENITVLKDMAIAMSNVSQINPMSISSIGDALSNTLSGVNSVDISQVQAVTNMFNAFNGINKSKNIINKFTESVKEFTSTCNNLIDAMSNNTDAINNIDTNGISGSVTREVRENNIIERVSDNNTSQSNGIRITNVDEIARTIAEKINGALSVDVPDAQVQLLINGTGGNEWTITRY